jgi:predicted nuclease with TOPRIM domain
MSWIFGRSKEDKSNEENEQLVMAKSINKQITKENIELKEKLKNVESEFNSIKVKYEKLKNKLESKEELKYYEDKNIEKYYDIVIT